MQLVKGAVVDPIMRMKALRKEARQRGIDVPLELDHAVYHHEAQTRGLLPYDTFAGFVDGMNTQKGSQPPIFSYEHVPRMVEIAERVVAGDIKRLLVLMPPRYFKTEIYSRLLPAYYLRKFPRSTVGLASYGADTAWQWSEDARAYYMQSFGIFKKDTTAKKRWGTVEGGMMWASGTSGPIMGRGFNLGVVDDPTNPEQAISPTFQRRFPHWWTRTFLGRMEPGAAIIFVMQRLGPDDPVDFLFRAEEGEGEVERNPQHWHVLCLDEIKSNEPLGRWKGPQGLPTTCTLEPDKRKVGQYLALSRFSKEEVDQAHLSIAAAASQRQQRPYSPGGDFWKKDWFHLYDELPPAAYNGGKDWDTAYTAEEKNSASAFIESYRLLGDLEEFKIYIHNLGWAWKEFPELVEWMRGLKGPHYVEEKATGKSAVQSLKSYGITAEPVAVKGDKFSRAAAVQPIVSSGRVYVRRSVVIQLLEGEGQGLLRIHSEMLQQGQGGLDVNDAFVQALHRHVGMFKKPGKRRVKWI